MGHRFDLHMHSACSDGYDPPAQVVRNAQGAGLALMALTDHDNVDGVPEAVAEGARVGLPVLPALEMDTEWPSEMHILGLDVDVADAALQSALETAKARRVERNTEIFARLKAAGYDILPYLERANGTVTRLHIAKALVTGGYADSLSDAFQRYLKRGCAGYYAAPRFAPEEVLALIRGAGGVPVWAHPSHTKDDRHALLPRLIEAGLMGVEAYHPSQTAGESALLVSLARQHGLLVTCGSDSHGANRPQATIGCTWRETAALEETYAYFAARMEKKREDPVERTVKKGESGIR